MTGSVGTTGLYVVDHIINLTYLYESNIFRDAASPYIPPSACPPVPVCYIKTTFTVPLLQQGLEKVYLVHLFLPSN